MNYQKHYEILINLAKNRILDSYTESHHIIPKCIGGNNEISNLVDLTPEEHYIAHQLLVKIYPNERGLIYSAIRMTGKGAYNRKTNNKLYGWLKQRRSELGQSDDHKLKNSLAHRGEKNHMFGNTHTDETKKKLSIFNTVKVMPGEVRKKISTAHLGREVLIETREKISKIHAGKVTSEGTKRKISETKRLNRLAKEGGSN